jgi:hypothetical protein
VVNADALITYDRNFSRLPSLRVGKFVIWHKLTDPQYPGAGAAILIVTAVDRQPRPGITDFDFKESNIRLNF